MLMRWFTPFCCLLLLVGCRAETGQITTIEEASGVKRLGDYLLVVDDRVPQAYFRIPLQGNSGPLIPLNRPGVERITLSDVASAVDLEGIDQLADGRIAVLSERFRSLIGEAGVIAEYDSDMAEFARRGLEGVCVYALPGGSSRIAALWEGGYPDYSRMKQPFQEPLARSAMSPKIVVHDLKPGASHVRVRTQEAVESIDLEVPKPPGDEPEAQRFRAPDLVWYRWQNGKFDEWGFLVLITSQNSSGRPRYLNHWLQRFSYEGKLVGEPLDLAKFVPPKISGANWEGMCWFEKGESVVLVHEGEPGLPPNAFILKLPADWQFTQDSPATGK